MNYSSKNVNVCLKNALISCLDQDTFSKNCYENFSCEWTLKKATQIRLIIFMSQTCIASNFVCPLKHKQIIRSLNKQIRRYHDLI